MIEMTQLDEQAIDHYKWSVLRAYEYIDRQEYHNAFASFESDMRKNDQTIELINSEVISTVKLATMLGGLNRNSVIKYITGFPWFKEEWVQ